MELQEEQDSLSLRQRLRLTLNLWYIRAFPLIMWWIYG